MRLFQKLLKMPTTFARKGVIILFMLAIAAQVAAQEVPVVDGEIEDAQVIIEKDRKIVLPFAQRFYEKISDQYKPTTSESPSFSFMDIFYAPPSSRLKYTASEYSNPAKDAMGQSEIKLGYGNYNSPLFNASLYNIVNPNLIVGLDVEHLSFGTGPVDGANSAAGTSGVSLKGKYLAESIAVSGRLNYNSSFGHFYGYDQSQEVLRDTIRQNFNEFNASFGIEGNPSDAASYGIQAGYNLITNNFEVSESKINLGTKFQFAASESVLAGLALEGIFSKYEAQGISTPRNLYRAKPRVMLTFDQLTIGIGAKVVMLNDETYTGEDLNFFPDISINYAVADAVNIYGGLSGDIKEIYYDQVTKDNFFVSDRLILSHANQNFEAKGGLKGGTDKFGYDFFVSYGQIENMSFFTNGIDDSTRFDLIYDEGKTKLLTTSLQIGYKAGDRVHTQLNATYYNYTTDRLAAAWHRPTFEANLNNMIKVSDKVNIKINCLFVGGIQAVKLDGFFLYPFQPIESMTTYKLPVISDISIQGDYKITENWGAFIMANNILNSNYERYWNYPNRGLMLKLGIKYSF